MSIPSHSLEWIIKWMVYEHLKKEKAVNISHFLFTNKNHASRLNSFHDKIIRPKA